MNKTCIVVLFSILAALSSAYSQPTISLPSVNAGRDTTLAHGCITLKAVPVSGYQTTDYSVAPIPYNPYPWVAGTKIDIKEEDSWGAVENLPFDFCFYGDPYHQVQIGSNGLLSFDLHIPPDTSCPWDIVLPIPNANPKIPKNCILGPWHDIDIGVGTGVVHTALYGTAPRRVFVLAIKDNGLFSAKDTCKDSITTQQVAIYETTNIVEVYIERKNLCHGNSNAYAILGLHNYAGSKAVVAPGRNYPVIWTATNEAWRWMPIGPKAYTTAWYVVGNPIPISNDDSLTLCSQAQCTVSYVARTTYRNCNGVEVTVSDTVTVAGGSNAAEFQSDPSYPAELFIPNATVNFHNDAPADSPRHWDFGNGDESTAPNPSHTFPAPGTYFVTLVVGYDGANCNDTVTHGPYVVKMPEVSVPNVFSPNADGINDFFLVQYTGSESFFCAIYDRWGILQWSTNNKLQGWNGENGRGPVPDGVYFYRLRIGERDFSGELTLLR